MKKLVVNKFDGIRVKYLDLETTEACPLRCVHCYKDSGGSEELSPDVICDLVETPDYIDTIAVTGAEPSVAVARLENVYNSACKGNVRSIRVISNGVGLKKNKEFIRVCKLFNRGFLSGIRRQYTIRISNDEYHREACEAKNIDYDQLIADAYTA